ncbi:NAD(P)/FAD-dependent oxidoreductase [Salinisphaera orenii]|uniref:NAD(P)/FAD-dependent oxidoreductase n=1 Tax=Salinisphaera orenii TaxID=856731 RepID=UPI000DBEA31A
MNDVIESDVAIIGAGPAGSTAATWLADRGWHVRVVERSHFPRFAIGESLLPKCMDCLAEAGLLEAVRHAGYQIKRGVRFGRSNRMGRFYFADAAGTNWDWTWHVQRADFDQRLASEASRRGAIVGFGETVESIDRTSPGAPRLGIQNDSGESFELSARFVLDASGAGRVLPKLLHLEAEADGPDRAAVFTHVADGIEHPDLRRDELMITVHPERADVWYWLIAFSDGRASIGVVGDSTFIANQGKDAAAQLRALIAAEPQIAEALTNAKFDRQTFSAKQFATPVDRLFGQDFALLGNAGEFVDPIFSSGVTVALQSAISAAELVDRQLGGESIDWQTDFERPLRAGLNVFRAYVDAWYDASLQDVFFTPYPPSDVRQRVGSILAGYVWNGNNPFVVQPKRRLRTLCRLCAT